MAKKSALIKTAIIFVPAFIIICSTLYSGQDVVLTNNGDFFRIANLCSLVSDETGEFRIALAGDNYIKNIGTIFLTPRDISQYPSAQLIFVRLAVAVSYTANLLSGGAADAYNPFYLSFMMAVLYAAALAFTLSQIKIKNKILCWAVTAIILVMMCDIGYVSYFNSLYGEGLQHIFLIFTLGFMIKIWQKPLSLTETVFFAISLILFGQSKFFNIPVAILIGVIGFVISMRHSSSKRKLFTSAAAIGVSAVVLLASYSLLPQWISKETNYNSVFYGIVKDCDDSEAKQYLRELGLDSDMYVLGNTHHYVSNFAEISQEYNVESAEDISKLKLLMFYARHPIITLDRIADSFNHSSHIRNIFFMDESYMEDMARCTLWSKIREHSGFDRVFINLAILAVFFALTVMTFSKARTKKYITFLTVVIIGAVIGYSIFIPYVSNGEADLAKHMFLYAEFTDIFLISILLMCIHLPLKAKISVLLIGAVVFGTNALPSKKCEELVLGGYTWQVIDENSQYKTLMAKDSVACRGFDGDNNNFYEKSDIHTWLNGTFLKKFSEKERELMYKKEEKILLSKDFITEAKEGNRDFYCSAFPDRVVNNYDSAYGHRVSAYVFLPTAEQISQMAEKGMDTSLKNKYWLSTPYFNSGEKTRYVHPDGLIYFDYTSEEMDIRPVIYIKK